MSQKMAFAMGFEHGLKGLKKLVHRDGRKYPNEQDQMRYNVGYRTGAQKRLDKAMKEQDNASSNLPIRSD
jgi:hypothetical protein